MRERKIEKERRRGREVISEEAERGREGERERGREWKGWRKD